MKKYLRVIISATSEEEANKILEMMVNKHLAAGGKYTKGDSIFWWEDKIDRKPYYDISAFTLKNKKEEIISEVEKIHSDKVPVIHFYKIDYGIKDFLKWIEEYVK